MQDQINKIREACIAANPEILDLKFGCRFLFKGNNKAFCVALSNDEWKRLHFIVGYPNMEPKCDSLNRKDLIEDDALEIIGRPIRLADVLVAIMTARYDKKQEGKSFPSYTTIIPELMVFWNLLKDDLTLQSPECIEFISNLLQ